MNNGNQKILEQFSIAQRIEKQNSLLTISFEKEGKDKAIFYIRVFLDRYNKPRL